ncbi:MAG: class I SAM-dependent methyltransferase, partial [Arsenophonus sp. ET-DL12-MAG3]
MINPVEEKTDFGFNKVDKNKKAAMVASVFHSVAEKYDFINDLISLGIHRIWKHFMIEASGVRCGQYILDLAGGTGDITAKFSKIVGEKGRVILVDINSSMLKVGRAKLRNLGIV